MNCNFPHQRNNYDKIIARFQEITKLAADSGHEDMKHEK